MLRQLWRKEPHMVLNVIDLNEFSANVVVLHDGLSQCCI